MAADYLSKWVDGAGQAFDFSGIYALDRDGVTDSGTERRLPSAEVGDDGELATGGLAVPRIITIGGTLVADDGQASTIRTYVDALSAAFKDRREGLLYIHSDRFALCRLTKLDVEPENSLPSRVWHATFRSSLYPFWLDVTEWNGAAAAGAIVYPAMGTVDAPTRIDIVVTATGAPAGSISIAHAYGVATLRPSATGTYTIDGSTGTVTRGATDAISDFYGVFPRVGASGGSLAISTLSGAAYSGATGYVRALYESL